MVFSEEKGQTKDVDPTLINNIKHWKPRNTETTFLVQRH